MSAPTNDELRDDESTWKRWQAQKQASYEADQGAIERGADPEAIMKKNFAMSVDEAKSFPISWDELHW